MSAEHEAENKRIQDIVDRCASQIREHVDTVQILVTLQRDDTETTMSYEKGIGNFYARQGQVQEWLTMQTQYQIQHAIRKDAE